MWAHTRVSLGSIPTISLQLDCMWSKSTPTVKLFLVNKLTPSKAEEEVLDPVQS